jgi:hypothetical protein
MKKLGRKRQTVFQQMVKPVATQAEQALVASIRTVDAVGAATLNDVHAQIDHPQISQARRHQQARDPFGVRQVTLMNVKAATLLVREQRLNAIASSVP